MKWIYLAACVALYFKMLVFPNLTETDELAIVDTLAAEGGVPNVVSVVILRNRLYDTCFEVMVFTLAIMGVKFLLADEQPTSKVEQFTDLPSIVLARLGATIVALIAIELSIRGHLSPGGGFAAGVAGGTAIGLVAITSSTDWMRAIYTKWQAERIEKVSVLVFLVVSILMFIGIELPHGEMGTLVSGGWLAILNIIVALKVALGSWAAILTFIRYRGLL